MVDEQNDPAAEARDLLRGASIATLATAARMRDGWPFASLVLIAHDRHGAPLLLLSDLAEHSRNIKADERVSLLVDGTAGYEDALSGPRLTVLGRARRTTDASHRERFLASHASAAQYADFADFALYRVTVDSAHLVTVIGRIHWITAEALLDRPEDA